MASDLASTGAKGPGQATGAGSIHVWRAGQGNADFRPCARRLGQLWEAGENRHHCHIKKGRPTYVAVWEEMDGAIQLIEVTYVGTHEKAPY